MKKITIVFVASVLIGCGGGGGSGDTSGGGGSHAPVISNLTYSPNSAYQNQNSGSLPVNISFDFTDAGGDVKKLQINRYDSSGNLFRSSIAEITGVTGATTGIVQGNPPIDTSIAGDFRVEFYIIDSEGSQSNVITGQFQITPLDKFWGSPALISVGGSSNNFDAPNVATSITGDYFVVWSQYNGTNNVIKAKKYSLASGWGTISDISSTTTNASQPKVAMDSSGNAICVWSQDKYIYASKYTVSGGWGNPQIISNTSSDYSTNPVISMNLNGDAIAVWSHLGYPVAGMNVWASIYRSSTGWSLPYPVDSGSSVWNSPKAIIDANGNAIVTWISKYTSQTQNVSSRRYDTVNGWGVTQLISSGSNNSFFPSLAMDSGGNAMAIWTQVAYPSATVYARLYNINTGWGTTMAISSSGLNMGPTDIAGGSDGNFIAVWQQEDPYGNILGIYSNNFNSSTGWQTASPLSLPHYSPKISMNNNNDAVCVSVDANGCRAIRYKYGSGWLSAQGTHTMISPIGSYQHPIVAINQNGDAITASNGVNAYLGIWVTLLQ